MSCSRKSNATYDVPRPECLLKPMHVPEKRLLGAGPSNSSSVVLASLSRPTLGHMHPEIFKIMDDVKEGLKYLFQTDNPLTLCISASGSGGMEAAMCNLVETGDVVLCGVSGLWGRRAGEMATRYGADVRYIEAGSAVILTVNRLIEYFEVHRPKVFFITQGDSTTGVLQPIEELGDLCRKYNCLLVVDTVASLGGTPFFMDKWKVDVVYSGTQKVIGAPAGLSPISFGPRAIQRVLARHQKVAVFYWDIMLLSEYWNCFGKPRAYHHTISAPLLYGLREALAAICEEGLERLQARHLDASNYLKAKLVEIGFELYVKEPQHRLPTVTAIKLPPGIDYKQITDFAMENYSWEIAGGLGPTAGQIIRIGLMGENAKRENVDYVIRILQECLAKTNKVSHL